MFASFFISRLQFQVITQPDGTDLFFESLAE